jgi:hypothetical protein
VAVRAATAVTVVAEHAAAAVDGDARTVQAVEEVARLQQRCTGTGGGEGDAEKERRRPSGGDRAALRAVVHGTAKEGNGCGGAARDGEAG